MATLKISTWNVNGLRAALKSGEVQKWLETTAPDIIGMQEVKATEDQVDATVLTAHGYVATWHPAERPGYSGSLLLTKPEPLSVQVGLGIEEFDNEGRVIQADYPWFTVITAYFPNGGNKGVRLPYKHAFYEAFLAHVDALQAAGKKVIFMGDLNVAHTEMDVARPEEAVKGTGFLPEERAWIDRLLERGYVDTFRTLHPDERDAYTYWDAWRDRRARNVGWRIDYVWVTPELLPSVRAAFHETQVFGSDHCPVTIEIEIPELA